MFVWHQLFRVQKKNFQYKFFWEFQKVCTLRAYLKVFCLSSQNFKIAKNFVPTSGLPLSITIYTIPSNGIFLIRNLEMKKLIEMKICRSFENQKIMNEEVLINSGCFGVLDSEHVKD